MNECERYARWVLEPDNHFKTGRFIKKAAERFLNDLKRTDIYFDEKESMILVDFAERHCHQWEGDWRGKLVTLEPWQKFVFMQLFGWIRKDTGTRRFTKLYLQIAKKNGKSTMCAVLALFHLYADTRVNTPKVFTAANNEEQARICVNMSGRIVEQSPDLMDYVSDGDVKLMTYGSNITEVIHKEKDGFIKAMSKEGSDKSAKTAGGKHGINASLGLVDEFGMSPDHGASGSISTSMASRKERLMAYLTTSGFNREGPCYKELRAQGIKVLDGVLEMDNYLPIIFEMDAPESEDGRKEDITIDYLLKHPELWVQCNPNLGVSVQKDYLIEMLKSAQSLGGTTEVDVKTLNFNMWVDSPDVFISSEVWMANNQGGDINSLVGQPCYGGIELGRGEDMGCFALVFPGDIVRVKPIFMIAQESLSIAKGAHENFADWAKEGYIKVDPGNVIENEVIIKWILAEMSKYDMHSFAFPTPMKTNSVVQALISAGYEGNPISQSVNGITSSTTEWEKALRAHEIEHFGNPVLAWQNSNCLAVKKEIGIRIEKSAKVFGIYAILNAWAQWKTIAATESNDKNIMIW